MPSAEPNGGSLPPTPSQRMDAMMMVMIRNEFRVC